MTSSRSKTQRSRARGWLNAALALVLAASLAGCGAAETGLQRDAARRLQERVLGVSQAAAANDHAAALLALDSLETDLASAFSDGQVSEERRRTIMTVVSAVRGDLTAAVDAAATAAAAKAAEEAAAAAAAAAAEKAKADAEAEAAAKAVQENAVPVVPVPVPAQEPAPAQGKNNEGKGNEGKGKGKNG